MSVSPETQMLNVAASEYRLLRASLACCVTALRSDKERDEVRGKTMRWAPGSPNAMALAEAELLLKPKHPAHPLPKEWNKT